jgi:hypothetical protein
VTKVDQYRAQLRGIVEWEPFLIAESHLPGPRANLELLHAAADVGDGARFRRWLALGPEVAPSNSPAEFLPACGAVGLGRLAAEGDADAVGELRAHAGDPRWRVREGVAMGLQRLGAADMPALLRVAAEWSSGSWLERRAVVAALCEPSLLREPAHAAAVLRRLDALTQSLLGASDRRDEGLRVLRRALAYGWSVAVVALPEEGRPLMERWLASADPDVRWLMRENLKKERLRRLDPAWVERRSEETARTPPGALPTPGNAGGGHASAGPASPRRSP